MGTERFKIGGAREWTDERKSGEIKANLEQKRRNMIGYIADRFACRNKRRGCKASPSPTTASGNADRIRYSAFFPPYYFRGCKWGGKTAKGVVEPRIVGVSK